MLQTISNSKSDIIRIFIEIDNTYDPHLCANLGRGRRSNPTTDRPTFNVRVSFPPRVEGTRSCLEIFYKITDGVLICCGIIIVLSCLVSAWIGFIGLTKRMGWNLFEDFETSFGLE